MYSTVFRCFFVVSKDFGEELLNNLTQDDNKDKVDDKVGHCDLAGSWTMQSRQKCCFFADIQIHCKFFLLQPKKETSSSSLRDSNRTICAKLQGLSGFPPVPFGCLCAYQLIYILKFIGHLARVVIDTDTIGARVWWWVKQQLL